MVICYTDKYTVYIYIYIYIRTSTQTHMHAHAHTDRYIYIYISENFTLVSVTSFVLSYSHKF
jgi:hypothetical protein